MEESFSFKYKIEEPPELDINVGEVKVIKDDEICLTCSGVRRIVWAELIGNKKIIKKACLSCLCSRCLTARNREDP